MNRAATFTLDETDLRRANRLNLFGALRDPKTLRGLALLWGVSLLPLAGYHLGAFDASAKLREAMLIFALLATAAILAVYLAVPLLLGPVVIRRRFREEKLLREPVSINWDAEAYEASQPGVHNRIPWGDYLKWREDRHLFVFYLSSYNFQVVPKRVLSDAQIADIRQMLPASPKR